MLTHLARLCGLVGLSVVAAAVPAAACRSGEIVFVIPDPDALELSTEDPAPTSWTAVAENGPGLLTHAMVYDPGDRRVLGFGGAGHSHQVWSLSLDHKPHWSLLEVAGEAPCARRSASAILDPRRRRMIVLGGFNGTYLDDLWELRLEPVPVWRRMVTEGDAPPPLAATATVYDPVRDRMLVIQGRSTDSRVADVWALELSGTLRWRKVGTHGETPVPRSAHSAIYDPPRDRIILFGGGTPEYLDELWELKLGEGATWNRLDVQGRGPGAREEHAAVYDPVHQQMVIHGGTRGYDTPNADAPYMGDVWTLSLDGPPRWREIAGLSPGKRWGHRGVWDPGSSRMIVHGGRWATAPQQITWALSPGGFEGSGSVAAVAAEGIPEHLGLVVPPLSRGLLALRLLLPSAAPAKLELFDVTGRRSASQLLGDLGPGAHHYRWRETESLAPGVYWLRATSGRESLTEKVILLR